MSSSNDIMIQFENVTKSYSRYGGAHSIKNFLDRIKNGQFRGKMLHEKDFLALNDVSFTIRRGEKVGFIGHNGAGKSTTLKLVNSISACTSGKVTVNGKVGGLIELGSGFHQDLSGRENVFLNAAVQGFSKEQTEAIFKQIENIADIGHFINVPIKRYSSGMKVRLGFAVAIASTPDIVLLDEVLSVGDANFKQKSLKIMEEYLHEKTLLFVSHSMGQIKKVCDRVIVLNAGKLVFDGATDEAIEHYNALVEKDGWIDRKEIVTATKRGFAIAPLVEVKSIELNEAVEDKEQDSLTIPATNNISGYITIDSKIDDPKGKLTINIRRNVLGGITTVIDSSEILLPFKKGVHKVPFQMDMTQMPCAVYQLNVSALQSENTKKYASVVFKKKFGYGERSQFKNDKLVDLNIQIPTNGTSADL